MAGDFMTDRMMLAVPSRLGSAVYDIVDAYQGLASPPQRGYCRQRTTQEQGKMPLPRNPEDDGDPRIPGASRNTAVANTAVVVLDLRPCL